MYKLPPIDVISVNNIKSALEDYIEQLLGEADFSKISLIDINKKTLKDVIFGEFHHNRDVEVYIELCTWRTLKKKKWLSLLEILKKHKMLLEKLELEYNVFNYKIDRFKKIPKVETAIDELNEHFKVLNYDTFPNEYKNLIKKNLNIDVCPYCNRNYTTGYYIDGEYRSVADLDHFYPKSIFPMLQLSIYNLIPICPSCNRNKSSKVKKTMPYPYDYGMADYFRFKIKFDTKNVDIIKLTNFSPDYFEVIMNFEDSKTGEMVKEFCELIHLQEIYKNGNNNFVSNLLKRLTYLNDESTINAIRNVLSTVYDPGKVDVIINLYLMNNPVIEDKGNTSLSKLQQDIIEYNKEIYK